MSTPTSIAVPVESLDDYGLALTCFCGDLMVTAWGEVESTNEQFSRTLNRECRTCGASCTISVERTRRAA